MFGAWAAKEGSQLSSTFEARTGYDCDDFCSYSTAKYVVIKDRRLGLLKFGIQLVIFVYIVAYEIFWRLGYYTFYPAEAQYEFWLREPDQQTPLANLTYCCNNRCNPTATGCDCGVDGQPDARLNCTFFDGLTAGVKFEKSMLVVTEKRMTNVTRNPACSPAYSSGSTVRKNCRGWLRVNGPRHPVAEAENFLVEITHTLLRAPGHYESGPNDESCELGRGWLATEDPRMCTQDAGAVTDPYFPDGLKPQAPRAVCYLPLENFGTRRNPKIRVRLGTLLQAAGQELDSGNTSRFCTRQRGCRMDLRVTYQNALPWRGKLPRPHFVYHASVEKDSRFSHLRVVQSDETDEGVNNKLVQVQRGVYIRVDTDGQLAGDLSLFTVLLTLTASMALLTVANQGVEALAARCFSHKDFYYKNMVDESPDYDDIVELETKESTELDKMLLERNLSPAGSTADRVLRLLESGWALEQRAKRSEAQASSPSRAQARTLSRGPPASSP